MPEKRQTFEQAVAAEKRELGRPLKQWEIDSKKTWGGLAETMHKLNEERRQRELKGSVPTIKRKED